MVREFELPPCARETLAFLYPAVDLTRVRFFEGLPWFARFAGGTMAMTLPAASGTSDFWVFFCGFDPCRLHAGDGKGGTRMLVHEAYHLAQMMSMDGGRGFSFTRAGYRRYFRGWLVHGYFASPWEATARHADELYAWAVGLNVCDCASGKAEPDLRGIARLRAASQLVVRDPQTPICGGRLAAAAGTALAFVAAPFYWLAMLPERIPRRRPARP
ncbi:MAG: hypothetical protein M3N07_07340 [Pseudomonadota bacterium]|nr:hypothetical protein [Pseudomonadota bacterium]